MISQNIKKIAFGIGSNLGDRKKNIELAINKLSQKLNLVDLKTSEFYANVAMLPNDASDDWNIEFLNVAVVAKIDLEVFQPLKILSEIKKVEKEIGRLERPKWAPREIDIDILAIEDLKFDDQKTLQIPHQGLFVRDFFYKTFAQIDQKWLTTIKNQ